ncbi:MAG: GAF domain-containing protein [Candidatus Omnitrophota bacterium]
MSKYLFFTNDSIFVSRVKTAFPQHNVEFKQIADFPKIDSRVKLAVIDGDSLPFAGSQAKLRLFKRRKIPVVYLFTQMDGKSIMKLLDSGVVSVLFKDYPPCRIKRELTDIMGNFNYLERVKEIAENDYRIRQFLQTVNSLTSDTDINKIMNDILHSMLEVFKLECAILFIVKNARLVHKIERGIPRMDYALKEWDMTDANLKWLVELQHTGKPLYITPKSKKEYKRYFPENTLLLPLRIRDQFVGLIAVSLKSGARELSKNEILLLKAFAEQTAVALENARLYWDVIQTREKLVKKEKEAFLSHTILSLNHEINNPLSIISMEAQLLQRRFDNNESNIENRIARIEKNIERIRAIVEKISSLNVENISLTDYISGRKMVDIYEHQYEN